VASIPDHSWDGLLPPWEGRDPTTNVNRSPYRCSWQDIIDRFATSPKRIDILLGLLGYRALLRDHGVTIGFQWLTGSFVERINREPNDVDVVTFFQVPAAFSQADAEALFNHGHNKKTYFCDHYPVPLSYPVSPDADPTEHGAVLVDNTTYWYGLFSHRRDTYAWKGFLRLDLLPAEYDDPARELLETIKAHLVKQQELASKLAKTEDPGP
jgi:hypothetical protein